MVTREVYRRFQGDFWVGGGELLRRRDMLGELFHGGICHGEENFHEGSAGFSSIIKKQNNEKINTKKFFQLKVRSSIKTLNEQILLRI